MIKYLLKQTNFFTRFDIIEQQSQMDKEKFLELLEKEEERMKGVMSGESEPVEIFWLTPMQAAHIEQKMNAEENGEDLGYILKPVRQPEQTLYKMSTKDEPFRTFAEQEETNLLQFYHELELVKGKVNQKQFHWFLTLEQLRRHSLSKYFMTLPDPLYLNMCDYRDVIGNPLDIRLIANKLLRGKYQTKQDFETDMVTMLQNFKIYFITDQEMFDIGVKFQSIFWKIYDNEQKYKKAVEKYKFLKQKCTPARIGRKKKIKKEYDHDLKVDVINRFNKLKTEDKKKILKGIGVENVGNSFMGNNLTNEQFQVLEQKMEQAEMEISGSREIKHVGSVKREDKRRINEEERIMNRMEGQGHFGDEQDVYFSDDDQPKRHTQNLKQILDQMEIPDYDSDQQD